MENGKYVGLEEKVINYYQPGITSLRDISKIVGIDHHRVKRILEKNNIEIIKAKYKPFSLEHRNNISKSSKGRIAPNKGKKCSVETNFKNMKAKLIHYDVKLDWLMKFDFEKVKVLNQMARHNRINFDSIKYIEYIEYFHNDKEFNRIYDLWISKNKNTWYKPSIDHIIPVSKNGDISDIKNFQILTWFENKCKSNIDNEEWYEMKKNLHLLFR